MVEYDQVANEKAIESLLEHKSACCLCGYARSTTPVRQFLHEPLNFAQVFDEVLDATSTTWLVGSDVPFADMVQRTFGVFPRSVVEAVHMQVGAQRPLGGGEVVELLPTLAFANGERLCRFSVHTGDVAASV